MQSDSFELEVVWAEPGSEHRFQVSILPGTTAGQVLEMAVVQARLGTRLAAATGVGVYGSRVSLGHVLEPGDRLEVYRPLKVDPKEARRQRAKQQR